MAIIMWKHHLIMLVILVNLAGIFIGLGLAKFNNNDDLADLRERASKGLVYVDSQSLVYKCEVK